MDVEDVRRDGKRALCRAKKQLELNPMGDLAAAEGIVSLHRICFLIDRANRLEETYDNLAKRFAERLVSALPPKKPEPLTREDLPPLPPLLVFPDGRAPADWPQKRYRPKSMRDRRDWNDDNPLADVFAFAMWFYLKTIPQMAFRSHEEKWQVVGLPFTIALTEWLNEFELGLQRYDEAMRRTLLNFHALVKERTPDLLTSPERPVLPQEPITVAADVAADGLPQVLENRQVQADIKILADYYDDVAELVKEFAPILSSSITPWTTLEDCPDLGSALADMEAAVDALDAWVTKHALDLPFRRSGEPDFKKVVEIIGRGNRTAQ